MDFLFINKKTDRKNEKTTFFPKALIILKKCAKIVEKKRRERI